MPSISCLGASLSGDNISKLLSYGLLTDSEQLIHGIHGALRNFVQSLHIGSVYDVNIEISNARQK